MDFTAILGWPLGWAMWLCYKIINNYGLAIILFTLFVKVILFPLGIKQQKSMQKMAIFQPKINAIQKKYANNKAKQQEELMKLYQEEGYNPMGGCLPLLIQMPILFGLINVVYNPLTHLLRLPKETINAAKELVGAAINKSSPEISIISAVHENPQAFSKLGSDVVEKIQSIDLNFLGINLGAQPSLAFNILLIIPILSGATAFLMSMVSMKMASSPQAQQATGATKGMMYFMPLLSLFFAFGFPAGVGLYWIASNVFSIAQTYLLNKMLDPKKAAEEAARVEAQMKEEQKRLKAEQAAKKDKEPKLTQKEIDRRRLAEARRQDALKYGEEYIEVTDKDLN